MSGDNSYQAKLYELLCACADFVQKQCGDRQPSHGFQHALEVAAKAGYYANEMKIYDGILCCKINIVAWLHDVYDYKYDHDGKLRQATKEFIGQYLPDDVEYFMKLIDHIGFSKERDMLTWEYVDDNGQVIKHQYAPDSDEAAALWREALDMDIWIRHIVSDADKYFAIGKYGVERCVEYNKEKNPNITGEELVKAVHKHAEEKLLILHKYFRTEPGKKEAMRLTEETAEALKMLSVD